jgi:hypothetical protein
MTDSQTTTAPADGTAVGGRVQALVRRLEQYNDWRRGGEGEQPEPQLIGDDIDAVIVELGAPEWDGDGEPVNIRAAAADALEWLQALQKPKSPELRRRLNGCIVNLTKFVHA